MRLHSADLLLLDLELIRPFETSYAVFSRKQAVLVRLHSSEGFTGYGEAPAFQSPWYTSEYTGGILDALATQILPAVLDRDMSSVEQLAGTYAWVRGHHAAKAALEAAFWHLRSHREGVPMGTFWGEPRPSVEVGISLGLERHPERLLRQVGTALEAGYRRIKLKIKPGQDREPIAAVRARFGEIPLSVDANGAYASHTDPVWPALDEFRLRMIEQPFSGDRLLEHARLRQRLVTPICLDESVTSGQRVSEILDMGSAQILCLKPALLGGFENVARIARKCAQRTVATWCGGMFETGIGKAGALQLASSAGFSLPADISPTERYFVRDVLAQPIVMGPDGRIPIPTRPGLGWEIDAEALESLTIFKTTVRAGV